MAEQKRIVFYGATGGCALSALARSLAAGHLCTALVRTPSKLTNLLTARSADTTNLTIVEGDIKSSEAVTKSLTPVPDTIIFSVGSTPMFTNILRPTLEDPHICEEGMRTVLAALDTLKPANLPLLAAVSTTGVEKTRDVPVLMMPLYHWALRVPHQDKRKMGELVRGYKGESVVLYPAMLTDGKVEGVVRVGYEGRGGTKREKEGMWGAWGTETGVVVGYTISREDVGRWMFEELVQGGGGEWKGKRVTLAY